MNLSRLAIRRPVTVFMVFVGLSMIGIFSAFRLPIEQFPQVEVPHVGIGIPFANSTAQEVEENVTRPVEEVLSTMSGIDGMFSYSRPGFAFFSIQLDLGKDITGKGIEAKELIEGIRDRLPDEVRHIQLRQPDPNAVPVLNMMITAPGLDPDSAYDVLDTAVRGELERIPGVNSVNLFGADENYVQVAIDPARVEAYRLDYTEIQRRLSEENFILSAGEFDTRRQEYRVKPLGQFESLDDVLTLPINDRGIKLKDVAEVSLVPQDRSERRHVDGERSLGVSVFKRPEANLIKVSTDIERVLARVKQEPEFKGMTFTALDSQATTVLKSLNDLRDSGLLGGLLSVMALFLFLRQIVTSAVIAITVPMALFATLGVMYFLDMTLNVLSLVGLMLAIGLLVDNSVVVSEAIALRRRDKAVNPLDAAESGVAEVGLAITAGTLTTLIVFVPSFMTDIPMVATVQQNIAIPLCVSLLGSLLVAQTLVPTLMSRLPLPAEVQKHPFIDWLAEYYELSIRWTLRHRFFCLLIAGMVAASGGWAYQQLDVNMNPEEDNHRLQLNYRIRGSMGIEVIESFVEEVEGYLLDNAERFDIENTFSSYNTDRGHTTINLSEESKLAPKSVQDMIVKELPVMPGVRTRFSSGKRGFGGGDGGNLGVKLIGDSTEQLIEIGDALIVTLEQYPMLANVRSDADSSRQELAIRLKPEQAGQSGVTAMMVAQAVNISVGGRQMRRGFQHDGRELSITMELKDKDEADLSTLKRLPIFLSDGASVRLETVADLEFRSTLRSIKRENRETSINISFSTREITPAEASVLVETIMEKWQLPPGYRWEMGQGFDDENEMFREMAINVVFAILLVYMLMAALFESVLFPTTVIMAIGYSAVGVFWFFWLTGTTLTSMALTGMLLLAGIVVNNGIVLLNRIIQLRSQGMNRLEAVVASGRHRLRPILMTVCTTVAGLLPLAIGDVRVAGIGPPYFPMARAIIGGLTFSTLVTLLLLPLLYVLLDDMKNALYQFWVGARQRAQPDGLTGRAGMGEEVS